MLGIIVRLGTGGLFVCLLLACAPFDEQQMLDREVRFMEAKEAFNAMEALCSRSGGAMQMQTRSLGKPDYYDYKSARCVRRN